MKEGEREEQEEEQGEGKEGEKDQGREKRRRKAGRRGSQGVCRHEMSRLERCRREDPGASLGR